MGADFVFQALPVAKLNKRRLSRLNKLASQTELLPGIWDDLADQHADLRTAISEYAGFDDNEKEVGTLTLPDLPYSLYISGGVSWGDDPTEAFRYMMFLGLPRHPAIPGIATHELPPAARKGKAEVKTIATAPASLDLDPHGRLYL